MPTDGPKPHRVRQLLREREDRPDPEQPDAERAEDRTREMRERVEPPATED